MKIVHYELVKMINNTLRLDEVILNVIVWYHGLFDSIVSNRGLLFISKFMSLLYYFFDIKRRLFILFHPQIDRQTEK